MASYFHVALTGLARTWLMNLSPRVDPILGRAVRAVLGELRQRVPAARCGGPSPRREAATRGVAPGLHLPLH